MDHVAISKLFGLSASVCLFMSRNLSQWSSCCSFTELFSCVFMGHTWFYWIPSVSVSQGGGDETDEWCHCHHAVISISHLNTLRTECTVTYIYILYIIWYTVSSEQRIGSALRWVSRWVQATPSPPANFCVSLWVVSLRKQLRTSSADWERQTWAVYRE